MSSNFKNSKYQSFVWKGVAKYDEADYGKQRDISFQLAININDNSFEGICLDSEYSSITDLEVKVKGEIDDDVIRFELTYPKSYKENPDGSLMLEKTGPTVVYYDGYFDERTNEWTGDWEFELKSDEGLSYYLTGSFDLSRNNELNHKLIANLGKN